MLNYNKIENNVDSQTNQYDYEILNAINSKKTYFFIEPALTMRVGWESFKIQLQAATSSYLNNPDYPFEDYHISLGLIINFAKRTDKNNPE